MLVCLRRHIRVRRHCLTGKQDKLSQDIMDDLAKKGDAKAKSALFDLVKGRNGDPYVEDVLRKALQAKEEWVEPMRIVLGMYGIGSN